ncbi:MAG TPA: VanW family protein [Fimbriimonadaceae bacterium]|nr:VanW family protein [Fimbriimonadaceae bacterium]
MVSRKQVLVGSFSSIAAIGAVLSVVAARYEPRVRPNTFVGPIAVGGLLPQDAAKRLRIWWETEKHREVDLRLGTESKPIITLSLAKLGVRLDDQASVSDLPLDEFVEGLSRNFGGNPDPLREQPKFTFREEAWKPIITQVESKVGGKSPAKVFFKSGVIERMPEQNGSTVDLEAFRRNLSELNQQTTEIEVPVTSASKQVPDTELAKIAEVVSEFSTKFSTGQVNRSGNLRLASQAINGTVLMPGQRFSFNGFLGKRTAEQGYKMAGIYRDGRHDLGLAGGICQVSTTLYNAALFANLKIVKRTNHSMPVPYVPLGRDAAVDYGKIDLEFENTLDVPIAISSDWVPGKLTFRVLGVKTPGQVIEIASGGRKSWSVGEKVVLDPNLPAGKRKVIEKGSAGHSISTTRIVKVNGAVVSRDPLGVSHYRGGKRIVAVGKKAATPSVTSDGL